MIVKGYDYSPQVPRVIIDDPIDCPEPYQESFGPTLEDRILDEAYYLIHLNDILFHII